MKSITQRNDHGLQKNRTGARVGDGKSKNNKTLPGRQSIDGSALNPTTTHILSKENTFKKVNIHHLFHLHHFLFPSILVTVSLRATCLLESLLEISHHKCPLNELGILGEKTWTSAYVTESGQNGSTSVTL